MRSNTLIRWAGCCFLLAMLFSCGPKKRVASSGGSEVKVSGAAKTAVVGHVAKQQLYYATFSGRAKSSLTINGKDHYDVTANIRIAHGEAIWISMTALMGIEVARVLVTPDSIKVINRLQSEYVRKPFVYLRNYTGSGLDFSSLERLLVGDVPEEAMADDLAVWKGADGYLLQNQVDDLQYAVRVGVDYQNNYTSITAPARGQQLEAFYADHQVIAGKPFPSRMEFLITAARLTLASEIRYSKVVYDEKVEMPFVVPSRYTEVQ